MLSVQESAELIAPLLADLPGVQFGNVLIKQSETRKNKVLAENNGDFSILTPLPVDVRNDIQC